MKIISLQFKNIHSLSGEHTIQFDKAPLLGAGLILITGPTGAGKSTLLDVISLALYNQIPRLPDISKKVVSELNSIMTHHSKEAWAAVTYESKGHRYISKWSIEINRNGNLNDYHMEIWHDTNQQMLDLKKSEVPQKNAELIGLNYQQFIKSIVLSQGEFAQFLKARHEERAELLEKITGTDIYRALGKRAFEKHKEVKNQYTSIQDLIAQLPGSKEEDLADMQAEVTTIDEQHQALQLNAENLTILVGKMDQSQKKKQSLIEITQQIEAWKQKDEPMKVAKNKLILHENLLNIKGELSLIQSGFLEIGKLKNELEELNAQINTSQQKRIELEAHLSHQFDAPWDVAVIKEKLSQQKQEMIRLDNEIQRLRALGDDLRLQSNELIAKMPVHLKRWHEEKISPPQAIKFIQQIRTEASNLLTFPESGMEDFRRQLQELQNNKSTLQELKIWITKFGELTKELQTQKQSSLEEEKALSNLQREIQQMEQSLEAFSMNVAQLRIEKENRLSQVSLNEKRSQLQADQPCPLCGSLNHPYCDQQLTFEIGHLEIELHQKEKEQKLLEQQLQKQLADASACKTKIQLLQQQIQKLELEQSVVQRNISDLSKENLNAETIDQKIVKLDSEILAGQKAIQAYETLLQTAHLEKLYLDLDHTLNTFLLTKKEREERYFSSDQWNQLQNAYDTAIQYRVNEERMHEKMTSLQTRIENSKSETLGLQSKISPQLQSLQIADYAEAIRIMLNQDEYLQLKETVLAHEKQGTTLQHTADMLSEEISLLSADLPDAPDSENYRTELMSLKNAMVALSEKRGALQEKIKQWHQYKQQGDVLEAQKKSIEQELRQYEMLNHLIGDAMGKQFANFAQELTMQQIILLANRRLAALTDRYLLVSPKEDGKVDLFIKDLYLGGTERSVKTLSGGETFVLSLALALSLSDLASKNVKLDCLFIDEGFGTLDGDTLDTVISTLERLQEESEKTIAIISHVDSLKERINTQIRLIRDSSGLSRLQVV